MPSTPIDLRSDTVTRPTPAMLEAMRTAPLGDDVLGDDPTVNLLQERVAALFGKEAACFVPSGTMANLSAVKAQTDHGDEVLMHAQSHVYYYETGGFAAIGGCSIRPIDSPDGLFEPGALAPLIRPRENHFARSRLLVIENTHNKGGGTVWPLDQFEAVCREARRLNLRIHLDGARIWNACAASGASPADYARHVDTISCCFSKGLGCPVGSAVVGDRETIGRVLRLRKMFGGAMRQSGMLAAAALHALDHHRARLVEDHANARRLAALLAQVPGLRVNVDRVHTNMVFFDVDPSLGTAADFAARLDRAGVRMFDTGPTQIRAVTHLDVSASQIEQAGALIAKIVRGV